jgi:hypothetical protein
MLRCGNVTEGREGHFASGPYSPLRGVSSCASERARPFNPKFQDHFRRRLRRRAVDITTVTGRAAAQSRPKVLAILGVSAVLKPTIDALRAKLAVLLTA